MPDRRQNEGVLGELLVSRYLVENNYWVYKSLSAHNPIDIIGSVFIAVGTVYTAKYCLLTINK